ncbi:MAG: amylo-alpha,6-glucosidase [Rhodoglobus sp.]|nr:amylo-alpha,6-glucosidase [Rhodoglobus sp.]
MPSETPRQPLLHGETVVLRAPTQAWSAADGSIGGQPIHGLYFSDVRFVSAQSVTVAGAPTEHIATVPRGADATTFVSVVRALDDPTPDPGVRAEHTRTATATGIRERVEISSRLAHELHTEVAVAFAADVTGMDTVKSGRADSAPAVEVGGDGAAWSGGDVSVVLRAPGASVVADALTWSVVVPAHGSVAVEWSYEATDALAVVHGAPGAPPWSQPTVTAGDDRITRWAARALADLDALRLVTVREPDLQFLAAGAPWFFTLFGRDSIWAARFMLPLGTQIAGDTLRILAGLQGTDDVPETAEEPGKIMHELRRGDLVIPGEGIHLPPLYFGTVDATALWVCLLHDAWKWGLPDEQVRDLIPHLSRALEWMRDFGDSDGDGLLEYADKSGRGLSNQGWKDSGDSVQWRDGTLATGPIALVEVQAYAYEAATHGADLLDAFGGDGAEWRAWAARLRDKFHESFWIEDADGAYLAIALDADKKPVDTVTSNLGHVLGTGILDERQAGMVARRLVDPTLNSGYGLRTMSTDSAGYWPLSYHGGSVWTHDTAIAISGLARDGFRDEADELTRGLLAAASGFEYRMPELHSGDAASEVAAPVPYPAACRPQAWSAAAAVSVLSSVLGLRPDAQAGELGISPTAVVGALTVEGLVFDGERGQVVVGATGEVLSGSLPLVVG